MNLFLLPLSHSNLNAKTDCVTHHNLGEHYSKTIQEIAPHISTGTNIGRATTGHKSVLIANVIHSEEYSRNQRNYHKENRTLRVDGVVNLSATHLCSLVWYKEESLRCIKERAESAELTSFREGRL